MTPLKMCSTCKRELTVTHFSTRRASPDGLAYKCRDCVKAACVEWRSRNPGAFKAWYADKKTERAEYWQKWYLENRERRSASYAAWAKKNPHIVNSLIAKRNAAKKRATPAWADQNAIRAIYAEASRLTRETGIRHEVDHIYPLQSDVVCGLHCEANLQIITKTENIRKSNKLPTAGT